MPVETATIVWRTLHTTCNYALIREESPKSQPKVGVFGKKKQIGLCTTTEKEFTKLDKLPA